MSKDNDIKNINELRMTTRYLKNLPMNEEEFIRDEYKKLSYFLSFKRINEKNRIGEYFLLRYKEYLRQRMEIILIEKKEDEAIAKKEVE